MWSKSGINAARAAHERGTKLINATAFSRGNTCTCALNNHVAVGDGVYTVVKMVYLTDLSTIWMTS